MTRYSEGHGIRGPVFGGAVLGGGGAVFGVFTVVKNPLCAILYFIFSHVMESIFIGMRKHKI